MNIGAICRCDRGGLGIQSKEFFDNIPCRALVIDIGHRQQNYNWFPNQRIAKLNGVGFGTISNMILNEFLLGLDLVVVFENPYDHRLFGVCRERGIKTILQLNYEFLETPGESPDLFAAPSMWHFKEIPDPKIFLPVPVNTQKLFMFKPMLNVFTHIAGNKAQFDRNGTETLLQCLKYVKRNVKIIIKSQHNITVPLASVPSNVDLEVQVNDAQDYQSNYSGGTLIMPRRYGGLSLPVNEALACGMPVIMTDIEPNNIWLPKEWLVPAKKINSFKCKKIVDVYEANTIHLAAKIDEFCDESVFAKAVSKTLELKERISWNNLRDEYYNVFKNLINKQHERSEILHTND